MVSTNKSELILKGLLSIYPISHDFERQEFLTLSNEFHWRHIHRGYFLFLSCRCFQLMSITSNGVAFVVQQCTDSASQ